MSRLLALAAGAALVAGCARAPQAGALPEIRIGLLALMADPFTETSGRPTVDGATFAVDEINRNGGLLVGGVRYWLRLVIATHSERTEEVSTDALRLINRDSVHVLIGPQLSRHAIPVARLANDAHVPMLSPMSSNRETTSGKPFVFRLAFLDDVQGEVLAHFARTGLGYSVAGVLMDRTDPYSRDLCRRFSDVFKAEGGRVIEVSFAGASDPDPTLVEGLAQFGRSGVRAVFMPGRMAIVESALRRADDLGLSFTFLGSDSWDVARAVEVPAAQGAYLTHQWHFDFPGQKVRDFVDAFSTVFGETPKSTAAMTYDAVHVMALAMEQAGSLDGDSIRVALQALDEYDGVTGRIRFRGLRDPSRSVLISKIGGGTTSLYEVVDPRP